MSGRVIADRDATQPDSAWARPVDVRVDRNGGRGVERPDRDGVAVRVAVRSHGEPHHVASDPVGHELRVGNPFRGPLEAQQGFGALLGSGEMRIAASGLAHHLPPELEHLP